MQWDEREQELLIHAAAAADRAGLLEECFQREMAEEARPRELAALDNAIRQSARLITMLTKQLMAGLEPPKNAMQMRKSTAAGHRWAQQRRRDAAAAEEA